MIHIDNNFVTSDSGLLVRRRGCVDAFGTITLTAGESADDFEEVTAEQAEADSAAAAAEERYDRLVAELVHRRYSIDREIALAANLYAPTEKRSAEYAAYQAYREQCKAEARHIIETELNTDDHGTDPEEI